MGREGFGERSRRRDRIPGADGCAAIHRAEAGRIIALDEDAVADQIGAVDLQLALACKILGCEVIAELHGRIVQADELVLALELFRDQVFDGFQFHRQELNNGAEIDDVLEQLALARDRALERVGKLCQRHAEQVNVGAQLLLGQRLGGIVEEIAAGLDGLDVLVPGLRVHRDHQVDAAAAAEPALAGDANFVPGRQALNVRRKDVARAERHAHAQDRTRKQFVRTRRARAVDVGEFDDEVVGGAYRLHAPAFAVSR